TTVPLSRRGVEAISPGRGDRLREREMERDQPRGWHGRRRIIRQARRTPRNWERRLPGRCDIISDRSSEIRRINHAWIPRFPGPPPMVQDDSFALLMLRLKAGDEAAATEVFGRFLRRLIVLASRQFDSWIRNRVDVEDVVQSAYKSFFAGQGE